MIFHSTNFVGFQTQFFFGKKCFLSANLTNFAIALPDFLFQKKRRERERERERETNMSRMVFFFPNNCFPFSRQKNFGKLWKSLFFQSKFNSQMLLLFWKNSANFRYQKIGSSQPAPYQYDYGGNHRICQLPQIQAYKINNWLLSRRFRFAKINNWACVTHSGLQNVQP